MTGRVRAAVFALVLVGSLAVAGTAQAHSVLVSASPAVGATVAAAPTRIIASFSEPPDPARSKLVVIDAAGRVRTGGPVTVVQGQPATLTVPVDAGADGVYTVQWDAVAADDGHRAAGSYSFAVAVPVTIPAPTPAPAPAPHVQSPAPTIPAATVHTDPVGVSSHPVRARWVYYLGMIGLLSAAFVALVVFRSPPGPLLQWALPLSWLTAAGGCWGLVQSSSWSAAFALRGRGAPIVMAALPVALVALGARTAGAAGARARRRALIAVVACAAASMLADVRSSHAAAVHSWAWLLVTIQWIHFLAVAVWIGGLVAVVACLRLVEPGDRREGVRRYSTVAAAALVAVAASGTVQAVSEVGTWHGLLSTRFGHLVVAKVAVVVVLAGLGAVNRVRHVPRVERDHRGLGRVGAVEAAIGVGALLLTALLQNVAPAAATERVTADSAVVYGADGMRSLRVALTRVALVGGADQFRLDLADYASRSPVEANRVRLRFQPASGGWRPMTDLPMSAAGHGAYIGEGANAARSGRWKVTVIVERASTATEVPLTLTLPRRS